MSSDRLGLFSSLTKLKESKSMIDLSSDNLLKSFENNKEKRLNLLYENGNCKKLDESKDTNKLYSILSSSFKLCSTKDSSCQLANNMGAYMTPLHNIVSSITPISILNRTSVSNRDAFINKSSMSSLLVNSSPNFSTSFTHLRIQPIMYSRCVTRKDQSAASFNSTASLISIVANVSTAQSNLNTTLKVVDKNLSLSLKNSISKSYYDDHANNSINSLNSTNSLNIDQENLYISSNFSSSHSSSNNHSFCKDSLQTLANEISLSNYKCPLSDFQNIYSNEIFPLKFMEDEESLDKNQNNSNMILSKESIYTRNNNIASISNFDLANDGVNSLNQNSSIFYHNIDELSSTDELKKSCTASHLVSSDTYSSINASIYQSNINSSYQNNPTYSCLNVSEFSTIYNSEQEVINPSKNISLSTSADIFTSSIWANNSSSCVSNLNKNNAYIDINNINQLRMKSSALTPLLHYAPLKNSPLQSSYFSPIPKDDIKDKLLIKHKLDKSSALQIDTINYQQLNDLFDMDTNNIKTESEYDSKLFQSKINKILKDGDNVENEKIKYYLPDFIIKSEINMNMQMPIYQILSPNKNESESVMRYPIYDVLYSNKTENMIIDDDSLKLEGHNKEFVKNEDGESVESINCDNKDNSYNNNVIIINQLKENTPGSKIVKTERATKKFSSKSKSSRPNFSEIGSGLQNLGNTCFVNATLQCLSYTPLLRDYLLLEQRSLSSCGVKGSCIMCELGKHVSQCFNSSGRIIKPHSVLQKLKVIARHMKWGRQEDAHEFLRYLIDAMNKSCLSGHQKFSPNCLNGERRTQTLINSIFGGLLRSQVSCEICGYESDTFDAFLDMSVDVKDSQSITDALNRFVMPETLEQENSYFCTRCQENVRAKKKKVPTATLR